MFLLNQSRKFETYLQLNPSKLIDIFLIERSNQTKVYIFETYQYNRICFQSTQFKIKKEMESEKLSFQEFKINFHFYKLFG